jgi:hypothetical protein
MIRYRCAVCAGVFDTEVSIEAARAEYERTFHRPAPPPGQTLTLCDDCYHRALEQMQIQKGTLQ